MTAMSITASVAGSQGVCWRPSAALRDAHKPRFDRRLVSAVLAVICAFALLLTAAPHASTISDAFSESSVAAQTDHAHGFVAAETPGTPVVIGLNSVYVYDGVLGCCVAPNSTRIFRAVEPDELADLRNAGVYRAGGPHAEWLDGKRFWLSQADADAYVALAAKADLGGPYCVTSGCIPNSVLDQIQVVTMDGMDAVFLPNDLLPFIDDLNLPSPP